MTLWTTPTVDASIEQFYYKFNQYRYNTPDICQTPFFTNHIRYEIDTRDVPNWSEYDYFELQGLSAVDTSMVRWYGKAKWDVIYVPHADASGLDSFTYSATDCPGTHTLSMHPLTPSQFSLSYNQPLPITLLTHTLNRIIESGFRSTLVVERGNRQRQHRSCRYAITHPNKTFYQYTLSMYLINTFYAGTAGTAKIDPLKGAATIDLSIWSVHVNINDTTTYFPNTP